ncbi:prealbumin-like fold domain-containing protein [Oribacterium sp. NK2B42]|uniref:prealbumin-like fold domain-containing protein n=1 Tax=Oribacterium sp. NK2B42 TaxID=689781 RepID=UPI0003FFD025|nr:prealbumin-like fold domain-containing protein [Oribacterium sp. NK2B42]
MANSAPSETGAQIDSKLGWACDAGYFVNTAGKIARINGRDYYKQNSVPAIGFIRKTPGGYWQPAFISTEPSSVVYNTSSGGGPWNYSGTFEYGGSTWYYFQGSYGWQNTSIDSDLPRKDFSSGNGNIETEGIAVLQAANVQTGIAEDITPTTLNISNCNAQGGNGGGIYAGGTSDLLGAVNLTNCTAVGSGGGFFANNALKLADDVEITAKGCRTTNGDGGAIYKSASGVFSAKPGAAISMGGTASGEECTASRNGGGLYAGISVYDVIDITAVNCMATGNGGGIYAAGELTLTEHSQITGCTAANGGGVYSSAHSLNLDDCTITNCTANNGSGGGVYANKCLTVNGDVSFDNCEASQHGGAVYVKGMFAMSQGDSNSVPSETGGQIDSKLGWTCDADYFVNTAGKVARINNSRDYYKQNSVPAIGFIRKSPSGYWQPAFISTDPAAVVYNTNDDGGPWYYSGTFEYGGLTWYYFQGNYGYQTTAIDSALPRHDFTGGDGNIETEGIAVLQAAHVQTGIAKDVHPTTLDVTNCHAESGNGGGAYFSAALNKENFKGSVSFEACYATAGNGGAIYLNAGGTLTNVSVTGHRNLDVTPANAKLGGAVYSGGNLIIRQTVTGASEIKNCSASDPNGGAVQVASGKTMTFGGNVVIYDNKSEKKNLFTGDTELVQANVVLSENSYERIRTSEEGLETDAKVGVYVTGNKITENPYLDHGSVHDDFGMHYANEISTSNLDKFINDRNGLKGEKCTDEGHVGRIRWGSALCKLTYKQDNQDNQNNQVYLLLKEEDGMTRPAVYHSFKDALADVEGGRLYEDQNNKYSGNIRLEMLKDYKQKSDDRIEYHYAKDILFTTSKSGETNKDCGDDFVYIGDSETAVIERGDTKEKDASMIKLEIGCGKVTIEKLTFDGNGKNEAFKGDGAIVYIKGESTLVLGDKAILRNGKTSGNGGAVYINSQGTLIIQGGEINNNTVTGSGLGAGVYVAEGATLKLDGNVNFGGSGVDENGDIVSTTGNIADRSDRSDLSLPNDATNGGKEYRKERQDIYIAEDTDEPASLIVTANVPPNIEGGSIWVYAKSENHYKKTKPFAVIEPADLELNENVESADFKLDENVYKAFRNARSDSETGCDGEYLSGSSGENAKLIYWSANANAVDVYFKKIDGYGEMLKVDELTGPVFTLYTSADCNEDHEYIQNGKAKLSEEVTEQEVINEGKFNLVFKGVPDGIYYMKETKYDTDRFRDSGKVYVVCVGSTALDGAGQTGGVLEDITEDDITARTVKGETKYDYAIFCLDDSKEKAKAIPDISTYGVMNISKEDDKVIMKKTDKSYTPLEGAEFDILSYDMAPVAKGKGAVSHKTGIFWVGKLPYGKYYIKETISPNGSALSSNDYDFVLRYNKDSERFEVYDRDREPNTDPEP